METIENISTIEIWHRDYNLQKKDNLSELPSEKAVFGIFGIVNDQPINCRFIGEAENLREAVSFIFENTDNVGLKKFMQGAWIQMLKYKILPNSSKFERDQLVEMWQKEYNPNVDDQGDYPGYYNA